MLGFVNTHKGCLRLKLDHRVPINKVINIIRFKLLIEYLDFSYIVNISLDINSFLFIDLFKVSCYWDFII